MHQSAEPTPPLSRPPLTFMQRKLKSPSPPYTYYGAVIAMTVLLVAGAGYWVYLDSGNARETVNRSTIPVQGGDNYDAQPQTSTIDIQGTWRRQDTRDLYTITQKGNSFEWTGGQPPGRSTTGTINGEVVDVNWPEECDNPPQRLYVTAREYQSSCPRTSPFRAHSQ
jgi:hypothetical protein